MRCITAGLQSGTEEELKMIHFYVQGKILMSACDTACIHDAKFLSFFSCNLILWFFFSVFN